MNKVINSHQINGSHTLKGTNRKLLLQSIYLGEKLRSVAELCCSGNTLPSIYKRRKEEMYICVEKMNLSEILDENFLGEYTVSRCNALYYFREIGRRIRI